MGTLLYLDTRVDVTCQNCGKVFRRPSWGEAMTCPACNGVPVIYGADEDSPICSMSGIELVAQRKGDGIFLGTRWYSPGRTTDDDPQEDVEDDPLARNQVFGVSENEARIYAERILGLLDT